MTKHRVNLPEKTCNIGSTSDGRQAIQFFTRAAFKGPSKDSEGNEIPGDELEIYEDNELLFHLTFGLDVEISKDDFLIVDAETQTVIGVGKDL